MKLEGILYYGDELGHPGSVMTFFEFPGAAPGRAGAGMIHRVAWRVRDAAALDFWGDRLAAAGVTAGRSDGALRFRERDRASRRVRIARRGPRGGRRAVADAGAHVTPVIDRDYFRSIYFREPSGVLFEIATMAPAFTIDEPAAHLGESLCLPRQHEHLREQLQRTLTPLENPRTQQLTDISP